MPEKGGSKENWHGLGKEWKQDVKTFRASPEKREKFYGKKAIERLTEVFKLPPTDATNTDIAIAKLKEKSGLTSNDVIKSKTWNKEKTGKNRWISKILRDFFAKECGSKHAEADTFAALRYLNQTMGNVDFIQTGETVEIKNAQLTILDTSGNAVARGNLIPSSELDTSAEATISREAPAAKARGKGKGKAGKKTTAVPEGTGAAPSPKTPAPAGETADVAPPDAPLPAAPLAIPPVPEEASPAPEAPPPVEAPTPPEAAPTPGISDDDFSDDTESALPPSPPAPAVAPPPPPPAPTPGEAPPPPSPAPAPAAAPETEAVIPPEEPPEGPELVSITAPATNLAEAAPDALKQKLTSLGFSEELQSKIVEDQESPSGLSYDYKDEKIPILGKDDLSLEKNPVATDTKDAFLKVILRPDKTEFPKKEDQDLFVVPKTLAIYKNQNPGSLNVSIGSFSGGAEAAKITAYAKRFHEAMKLFPEKNVKAKINPNNLPTLLVTSYDGKEYEIKPREDGGYIYWEVGTREVIDITSNEFATLAKVLMLPPKEKAAEPSPKEREKNRQSELSERAEKTKRSLRPLFGDMLGDDLSLYIRTADKTPNLGKLEIDPKNPENVILKNSRGRIVAKNRNIDELYRTFMETMIVPTIKQELFQRAKTKGARLTYQTAGKDGLFDFLLVRKQGKVVGRIAIDRRACCSVQAETKNDSGEWMVLSTLKYGNAEQLEDQLVELFLTAREKVERLKTELLNYVFERWRVPNSSAKQGSNGLFPVYAKEDSEEIAGYIQIDSADPETYDLLDADKKFVDNIGDVAILEKIMNEKLQISTLEYEKITVPARSHEMAEFAPVIEDLESIPPNLVDISAGIPAWYAPDLLTPLPLELRLNLYEAVSAFSEVIPKIQELHDRIKDIFRFELKVIDSHRDYAEQVRIKKQKPGLAAPPGFSEHQLGVAFDFNIKNNAKIQKWMEKNAHEYGFVRTVFRPNETWHWRYVGPSVAKYMKENGIRDFKVLQKTFFDKGYVKPRNLPQEMRDFKKKSELDKRNRRREDRASGGG